MLEILRIIFLIILLFTLLGFIVKRKDIMAWPEKEKPPNRTIGLISWLMCLLVFVFFILLLLPNDIFIFRNMGSIFYWIGIFGLGTLYFAKKYNPDIKDSEWIESKWAVLAWVSIFVFLIIYGLINP